MNIHDIYLNFLKYKNQENAESRDDGKFHASSTGSCYRKQMYRLEDYPQDDMDDSSYKVLRLGTVVHKDFENAIEHHLEKNAKEITSKKISIFSEKKVSLDKYNVTGTLDIGEYIEENGVFNLYGMAIKEELDVKELNMFLVFYNKNTSMIREVKVYADEWIDKATDYWEELTSLASTMKNGLFEEKLRPGWQFGVPYEDWECKYCNYKTICPSNLK